MRFLPTSALRARSLSYRWRFVGCRLACAASLQNLHTHTRVFTHFFTRIRQAHAHRLAARTRKEKTRGKKLPTSLRTSTHWHALDLKCLCAKRRQPSRERSRPGSWLWNALKTNLWQRFHHFRSASGLLRANVLAMIDRAAGAANVTSTAAAAAAVASVIMRVVTAMSCRATAPQEALRMLPRSQPSCLQKPLMGRGLGMCFAAESRATAIIKIWAALWERLRPRSSDFKMP